MRTRCAGSGWPASPGRRWLPRRRPRLAVETAVAQRDCAVIILTETVADSIRPQVERIRFESQQPLIVEIPGPDGPLPGRKSLRQLAQEAVGIHIEEKGN